MWSSCRQAIWWQATKKLVWLILVTFGKPETIQECQYKSQVARMYRIWLVLVTSEKKETTHKENQSQRLRTNYTNCVCLWFETTSILVMSLYKSWVNQVQAFIWDWTHQRVPQLTLTHSRKLTSMLWWHQNMFFLFHQRKIQWHFVIANHCSRQTMKALLSSPALFGRPLMRLSRSNGQLHDIQLSPKLWVLDPQSWS